MSISIDISKSKTEDIKKIQPNFTPNRFDILYGKHYNVLFVKYENKTFYIPYKICFFSCKLGIWLTELPTDTINEIIKFIFSHYWYVFKIKIISCTQNVLGKSDKTIDYWINLPSTQEEYISGLSNNTRYNLSRHTKKLKNEIGNYTITKYERGNIPIKIIKEYFKFKKITMGKSYFLTPKQYIKRYNVTSIYVLSINNNTEAMVLISEIGSIVYLENITYNPQLSKYSVGVTVCIYMILDLIKQGKSTIFFGSSNKDDYKRRLCNNCKNTYSIKIKRTDILIKK